MYFEEGLIYHVYNQGNNRERIFFKDSNYLFFLKKMRSFVFPYADFLCYCLMPNHFHWLLYVKHTTLYYLPDGTLFPASFSPGGIYSPGDFKSPGEYIPPGENDAGNKDTQLKPRSLNDSIAILLRSYTRAINKQENRSGSLFREDTKAKSGWIDEFITVDRYRKGPFDFRAFPDDDYGWNCFNYIHQNPAAAKLVTDPIDWKYSSAQDYARLRKGTLCNQLLARELLLLPENFYKKDKMDEYEKE